jgi:hypothetical protein
MHAEPNLKGFWQLAGTALVVTAHQSMRLVTSLNCNTNVLKLVLLFIRTWQSR